jgi:C2H2-type zinc finger/zinc-finger of a C2HC-type
VIKANTAKDTFDNKDVQSIISREDDEKSSSKILKCKICGVKFDNADAFEGHIAAGHLSINPPYEGKSSGPGHVPKQLYTCELCGRSFPEKEEFDTHRLQH